jgi:hypothetical protein
MRYVLATQSPCESGFLFFFFLSYEIDDDRMKMFWGRLRPHGAIGAFACNHFPPWPDARCGMSFLIYY